MPILYLPRRRRLLGGLPAAPMPLLPEELVDRRAIIAGQGGAAGFGASRQSQHRPDREEGEELPLEEVGWEGWGFGAKHMYVLYIYLSYEHSNEKRMRICWWSITREAVT